MGGDNLIQFHFLKDCYWDSSDRRQHPRRRLYESSLRFSFDFIETASVIFLDQDPEEGNIPLLVLLDLLHFWYHWIWPTEIGDWKHCFVMVPFPQWVILGAREGEIIMVASAMWIQQELVLCSIATWNCWDVSFDNLECNTGGPLVTI